MCQCDGAFLAWVPVSLASSPLWVPFFIIFLLYSSPIPLLLCLTLPPGRLRLSPCFTDLHRFFIAPSSLCNTALYFLVATVFCVCCCGHFSGFCSSLISFISSYIFFIKSFLVPMSYIQVLPTQGSYFYEWQCASVIV